MKTYGMNVLHKILFLPAFWIIAEMTIDPVTDIIGFAHINNFPFFVVEIIDSGV